MAIVSLVVFAALLAVSGAQDGWRPARGTYYGDQPWLWDIHQGSCGFGYIWEDEPLGWDVAALPDVHAEYAGSCGRCYEVSCDPTAFHDNYGNQLDRSNACQDPTQSVVVRITDTCPCNYPDNGYSNKRWCCGDMDHFDLSVWAFEKLAPLHWGVIGLRYRPVPCDHAPANPAPTPENAFPGVPPPPGAKRPAWLVNKDGETTTPVPPPESTQKPQSEVIQKGATTEGWKDESYNADDAATVSGPFGGESMCKTIYPGGGIRLAGANDVFRGHVSLEAWIRGFDAPPDLSISIQGNRGSCNDIRLSSLTTSGNSNGFDRYDVYLPLFDSFRPQQVIAFAESFRGCGGNSDGDVHSILLKNSQPWAQRVCIDNVKLI